MKKSIFIIILSVFAINSLYSQLKYKDVIEVVKQNNDKKSFSLLFQYQQLDPEFANTYFQLGNISFKWAINSDPLIDMKQTEYHIRNTKLFYELCISKLQADEKDAKRNAEFYKTIPEFENISKLNNIIVLDYINSQLEKINEYDKNAHYSAKYFHKLVEKYNETVDVFLQIIAQYDKLNDIYLEKKSTILQSTNNLILSFDSTVLYFEQYKISINNYPIKNYKQKLTFVPIKTYRLQGITRTNFLQDSILIWDYKSWAEDVQNNLSSDISHFRQTIIQTNKELTEIENLLINTNKYSNSYKTYEIDQKVLFETEKFDYNSLISFLFIYRKAKIDFLVQQKRVYNDAANYTVSPNNRAIEYYSLTEKKLIADSLLNELKTKLSKENYLKHKDFFDFNYKSYNGMASYIKNEQVDLNNRYSESLKKFQYFTYRDVFQLESKPAITLYNENEINLFVNLTEPKTAEEDKYYTLSVDENKNGDKYIAGYFKTSLGAAAFIAKFSNNEIEWLKNTGVRASAFEYGTTIKATPEGCVAIIHTEYQDEHQNSVIRMTSQGEQVYKKGLTNKNLPRFIDYDEINEELLLAYQGTKLNDYYKKDNDTLYIEKIDIETNSTLWKRQIYIEGQLINIIKMNTTYFVIANYQKANVSNQNYVNSKNNLLIINFSTNGKYLSTTELKLNSFFYGVYAYKINSKTINILGYNEKINNKITKYKDLHIPYYVIINNTNKIIFQNL